MSNLKITIVQRMAFVTNMPYITALKIYDSLGHNEVRFMEANALLVARGVSVNDAIDLVKVNIRLSEATSE